MKNNRGSLTMTAFFTMLIFSLYGILLYARSASAYNRQTKSIEKIQAVYAQDVPNAVMLAEQLGATTSYDGEYYAITIDLDNGSEVTSLSLMPGELVSKPATPVKAGYGFEGWYYI
ncbi:MAG: InlB B-repeat-containing protein, partial [Clostridia bacterium]|nr:InlB B-repeat-containing protein [Clostridia bacterium]